jgi:hypothetical protein
MCHWFDSGLGHRNRGNFPQNRHYSNTRPAFLAVRAVPAPPSQEAAVTAQPIAPVIPSRARAAARPGGRAGPVRRLPLAAVLEVPSLPDEVVYGRFSLERPPELYWCRVSNVPGACVALAGWSGLYTVRRPSLRWCGCDLRSGSRLGSSE